MGLFCLLAAFLLLFAM
uniref:Uncharacterized protein n=1 Tax=Bos mutus grunniens TaxID=30521 RepID=A0A8B9WFB6_BOSMU